MSDARSHFVGRLYQGAELEDVIELLGEPEGSGSHAHGLTQLTYRDMTLQLSFTYGRLNLVGCYFDRGDQSERDWPGPVQVPAQLCSRTTEAELVKWLEGQDDPWSCETAPGDVRYYKLGDGVHLYTDSGLLRSIFIPCESLSMGPEELLDQAVQLTSRGGLRGLTFGRLAETVRIHKSWICAHFKTKEQLRMAVVERAAESFTQSVLAPALECAAGLPRLEALAESWFAHVLFEGECFFSNALFELDCLESDPLLEAVRAHHKRYLAYLESQAEAAVDQGEFRSSVDPALFVQEMHALQLSVLAFRSLDLLEIGLRGARKATRELFSRSCV